jgi:cytochrome c oxidase assembly protein subunit 15
VKGGYVEHNASNTRVIVQAIHFSNTMALLAAVSLTWWWLGERRSDTVLEPAFRGVAWIALGASLLAGATGSVAALADTLFPSPSFAAGLRADFSTAEPLLVRIRWVHPAAAVLAALCAIWFVARVRSVPARWFAGLMLLQVALGAADVLLLAPLWLQLLHLAVADALWVALLAATATVFLPRSKASSRTKAANGVGGFVAARGD